MELAREKGMIRVRDLTERGLHPENLYRLCAKGKILRISRGLYAPTETEPTTFRSLAEVSAKVPRGVICLLSALRYHEIGTQAPHEVWLAVERNTRAPKIDTPMVRVVKISGEAFTEGIDIHEIEGVAVQVYSPAKIVADCFKFRNKIGLDVALEALRDCKDRRICTNEELWHYAKICRVANVIRPYLEVLS